MKSGILDACGLDCVESQKLTLPSCFSVSMFLFLTCWLCCATFSLFSIPSSIHESSLICILFQNWVIFFSCIRPRESRLPSMIDLLEPRNVSTAFQCHSKDYFRMLFLQFLRIQKGKNNGSLHVSCTNPYLYLKNSLDNSSLICLLFLLCVYRIMFSRIYVA